MAGVIENIRTGKYTNTMPEPWGLEKPTLDHENMTGRQIGEVKESYKAKKAEARRVYNAEESRLNQLFVADLEQENGLVGHPKAGKVYDMAMERSHSEGREAVAFIYADLAELVCS